MKTETVSGTHSGLWADQGFQFPGQILSIGPSQYDLTIACGPHLLHNNVDTKDICGKKWREIALKNP
jgi:hypothetical protein